MNRLLRASNLHKSYRMGREYVRVLRGASLEAYAGEFLVIAGASGSGKSTLLHLLGALDPPDEGTIEYAGQDMSTLSNVARRHYRNDTVGFVFQFYHLLPELTALENVMIPRLVRHGWISWRRAGREAHKEAERLIERVGLTNRRKHLPKELSGGERQRVAIARALINRPSVLLADEPTGNLDRRIGSQILQLLEEFNQAGQTIIMVTHDSAVASRAHRRLDLAEGVLSIPNPSFSKSGDWVESGETTR